MRGKQAPKHKLQADEVYHSVLVTKFINNIMHDGKKAVARTIVYKALADLADRTKADPVVALEKVFENIRPKLEVRSRRVGGANYQVPVPVGPDRQMALAMRWLLAAARKGRGSKEFWQVLSRELVAAYNGEGEAIRKRDDVQRMAESNRAFAQFAF